MDVGRLLGGCRRGVVADVTAMCPDCGRPHASPDCGVTDMDADIALLRHPWPWTEEAIEAAAGRVEAELSRLREQRDDAVRVYDAALRREEAADARCARLQQALRAIAEGNLGDAPWQANYERARQFARETLAGPEQA